MTYSKFLLVATALSSLTFADCAPAGLTIEVMQDAKGAEFETLTVEAKAELAGALVGCLGDPTPPSGRTSL